MPEKEGAEEKTTKSVVNKKQKQMMGEEGYDVARDEGRVRPSKDKKDATSYPVSDEMKKTQKVNTGLSALELVKKKYGKAVMDIKKEELDLTQVAESLGGYIVEAPANPSPEDILRAGGQKTGPMSFTQRQRQQVLRDLDISNKAKASKIRRNTNTLLDVLRNPDKYDPLQMDADIRADQAQKDLMRNPDFDPKGHNSARRSARKRYKNQPSYQEIKKGIDARELKKNPSYRARQVAKSSELSKNIKSVGPDSLINRQKRLIGRNVNKLKLGAADAVGAARDTARGMGKIVKAGIANPTFQAFRDKSGKLAKGVGRGLGRMSQATRKVASNLTKGGFKSVGKGLAKRTIGRAVTKGLAKQIPGLGQVLSGGEAIMRFAKGDVTGGLLSTLEMIPGLGMFAGAANVARDVGRTRRVVSAVKKSGALTKGIKAVQRSGISRKVGQIGKTLRKNPLRTAAGAGAATMAADAIGDRMRRPNIKPSTPQGGMGGRRSAGSFTAA